MGNSERTSNRWAFGFLRCSSTTKNYDLEQRPGERAYRPDVVERTAKVEAQIDKQIEKALARLANLKEYKRIYVPKTVQGRRVDAVEATAPTSTDATGD